MKVFAVIALVAAALSSVHAAAPPCSETIQAELIAAARGPGAECTQKTTYSIASVSIPTGDVLAKVCMEPSCLSTLETIKGIVTEDCNFLGKDIKSEVIDKFPAACASVGGDSMPTTAPTTTAPGETTAAPTTAPTEGSGSATEAPVEEPSSAPSAMGSEGSEGSEEYGSGSDSSESPMETPSTTPVPSTTSGASTVVAAAGAVAVAVTASLF